MATDSPFPPPPRLSSHGGIRVEDLKRIDIGQLSQSELQALSSCSGSAFDVQRTDDVVSPQLDRSVFNESAGSRRQTYSRLHHRSHSRLPGPHHSLKPHRHPHTSSDPVSHSIVHFLKHFLNGDYNPPSPPPLPTQESPAAPIGDLGFLGLQENMKIKHRRVRKGNNMDGQKLLENGGGIELQTVNGKGEVVDFDELERNGDDLYGEELKKRTVGLETEENVLGFLSSLEGQWCSRRKKRKYVDAGVFGDALPIGWKLLLGLRRRDYRVSVYCRRLISPTGQHFLSCKDAAAFLKSFFEGDDARQQRDQKTCSIQQAHVLSSGMNPLLADKTDDMAHGEGSHSKLVSNSYNLNEIDDCLTGIENLPEVQVKDIFECFKCNLTFDEKDLYLQHLFSFHQNTTKTYKFGTPVGEGVIIRDGKYECQFCHKVFEERRSYNGHVGSHVRNSGKKNNEQDVPVNVQQNTESPLQDALLASSLKADTFLDISENSNLEISENSNLEISENSNLEISAVGTDEQAIIDNYTSVLGIEEAHAASGGFFEIQVDHNAVAEEVEEAGHGNKIAMEKENLDKVGNDDYEWNVDVKMDEDCINDSGPTGLSEIEKCENSSLGASNGNRCLEPSEDHKNNTPGLTVEEIVFQDEDSSVPLIQSFDFFPSFDSVSDKGEHDFSVVDQKLENVTGFEELQFDDIEPFKYDFVSGHDFSSLPGGSMHLGNDSGMEDGFNSSVQFGSEEVMMLNAVDTNQLTVCVWCRTEFKLEGIESEAPSDSIGYMCPTCKAKISGHFGGGLSMDPHGF